MFAGNPFDGGASLFSGGAFMPSQSTQAAADAASFSPSKNRANQSAMPLTVKQITEAYHYSEDKSNFFVDGVEITNVRLVGLVMNKVERVTDVSFSLDDGTGRIDISRWVNEASDANEVAAIQNGMYVKVSVQMKGFHGKRHAFAFSVRPVIDFDEIALHFIECIYIHLENSRMKGGAPAKFQANPTMRAPFPSGMKGYQAPMSNQFQAYQGMDGSENDVHRLVLGVFQEPAMLAREQGLHVDELVRRLGIPKNKIMEAIHYHADVGHIYSTIDEYHFKSACNG